MIHRLSEQSDTFRDTAMTAKCATVHIDGAARGNPGPAAYAFTLQLPGEPALEEAQPIGIATNNVAEYTALVRALEAAKDRGIQHLEVFSDSELLVKQMTGEYRVKHPDLQVLYQRANELRRHFADLTLRHVRRSHNSRADFLCNEALDGRPVGAGLVADSSTNSPRVSVPSSSHGSGNSSRVKSASARDSLRDDALAYLKACASSWATQGVAALPVEAVWEHLWQLLEEHGVLKRK
jgi:ribonuclease HI